MLYLLMLYLFCCANIRCE